MDTANYIQRIRLSASSLLALSAAFSHALRLRSRASASKITIIGSGDLCRGASTRTPGLSVSRNQGKKRR